MKPQDSLNPDERAAPSEPSSPTPEFPYPGTHSTVDVQDEPDAPAYDTSSLRVVERTNYRVVGSVGEGGIGIVHSAHDVYLNRTVALKELQLGGATTEARFLREVLITARLQHPSIVPIYEAGRWPSGEPFYSMKLISGRTLLEAITNCSTLEQRLTLLPPLVAIADAMAYAHSQHIIHRDLKPANIVLGEFGETIVIDWGLAKDLTATNLDPDTTDSFLEPVQGDLLTMDGTLVGTPAYMSPEQAQGIAVDERADVYAMGAILYHLLAGAPPYAGQSMAQIISNTLTMPPEPLAQRVQGAPLDLLAIVEKAMSRDISQRYRTAKELAEDLRRFQTGQIVAAHRYSPRERMQRFVRRNRTLLAISSIATALLITGGAISVRGIVEAKELAETKQREASISEQKAIRRADELTVAQARGSLEHDPTKSIDLLHSLSPQWNQWGAVRTIAADAASRGIARIFHEHSAAVNDVVFSPDGKWLASVGDDHRVIVRNLQTNTTRSFSGHTDEVWRVVFSPRGDVLATGGKDRKVRLHDLTTNQSRTLIGHEAPITEIAFSPDGKRLASRGLREKVRLWDLATGSSRILSTVDEIRKNTRGCVVFSPNGKTLAFADAGQLFLQNLETDQRREVGPLAPGGVEMAFSSDGSKIVTGSEDGAVQLWDLVAGTTERLYVHEGTRAPLVTFVAHGKYIVSAGTTGTVHRWSIAEQKRHTLGAHAGYIAKWSVSRNDSEIVTAGTDGTVRHFRVDTDEQHTYRGFSGSVESASISPDGSFVAGASADGTVRLWDALLTSMVTTAPPAHWIAMSPRGTNVTLLSEQGPLYQVHAGSPLQTIVWPAPPNQATPAPYGLSYPPPFVYSPQGDRIAAAYADGIIRIFSDAGRTIQTLAGSADEAFAIAFSTDGKHLTSGGQRGTVHVWDIASGAMALLARHDADVRSVAYSNKGDWMASGAMDGSLRLTHTTSRESRELHGHTGPVLHLAFSNDDRTLLSASQDQTFRLWNFEAGTNTVHEVPGSAITHIHVFPDGLRFASLQRENQVRIWDMHTGEPKGTLRGDLPEIVEMAISSDGQRIAAGTQDGSAWLWDVASGEGRALTHQKGNAPIVLFGPDNHSVLAARFDGVVQQWADDLPDAPSELRAWLAGKTSFPITDGRVQ